MDSASVPQGSHNHPSSGKSVFEGLLCVVITYSCCKSDMFNSFLPSEAIVWGYPSHFLCLPHFLSSPVLPAGLWLYLAGSSLPCLTLIGSPNFGYRSVHRDLEAQVAIVTENKALQQQLHQVSGCFWGDNVDAVLLGHIGNADDAVAIKTYSHNNSKPSWA